MPATVKYFFVVKDGNDADDNDDAGASDLASGRFAISDGIAEGGFSKLWSHLLVDQFVQRSAASPDAWAQWLPATQQRWLDELRDVELPWYGEARFEEGSFATFLGLVVPPNGDAQTPWRAVAVGDSCLFHTRGGVLVLSFPLEKSAQFNFTPGLVGSRSRVDEVEKCEESWEGLGMASDRLWLMTDALSNWCLAESEAGRAPWHELAELLSAGCSPEQFSGWVDQLRAERGLHNDDVTLMAIEL